MTAYLFLSKDELYMDQIKLTYHGRYIFIKHLFTVQSGLTMYKYMINDPDKPVDPKYRVYKKPW